MDDQVGLRHGAARDEGLGLLLGLLDPPQPDGNRNKIREAKGEVKIREGLLPGGEVVDLAVSIEVVELVSEGEGGGEGRGGGRAPLEGEEVEPFVTFRELVGN